MALCNVDTAETDSDALDDRKPATTTIGFAYGTSARAALVPEHRVGCDGS
jgi:hypothetical protein